MKWILLVALSGLPACGSEPDAAPDTAAPEADSGPTASCIADLPAADIRLCDGQYRSLRELACGHPLTLIDIGVGTEPHCVQATRLYATDPAYDALQARGLNIIQVFLVDEDNDLPTTTWCKAYSEIHSIDFTFAMDPFVELTAEIAPTLPSNIVLDAAGEVIYEWAGIIPADKLAQLDELLPKAR